MSYPIAFQLLRQLSVREVKQFASLLETPAFNRRVELTLLLKWWQKHTHEMPDRRQVFQAVYADKPYRDRDWYLMLSRLHQLLEQFLGWEELRRNPLQSYPLLLQSLRRRKLSTFYERTYRQSKALTQKRTRTDAEILYLEYALEKSYYDFVASHKRKTYTNIQQVSDQLDHFFIAEKLKQACLAHSRGLVNQEHYHIHQLKAVEQELVERPSLQDIPAIRIYHACYQAVVQSGDETAFQYLRKVMDDLIAYFPPQEVRDIYLLAINYCIRALNRGEEPFVLEAFALYERSLILGHLLEDGHIPESTYSNIVSLGLKLRKFSWVKTFISEHTSSLRINFREPLEGLSTARLLYSQGSLSRALQELARVETKAPFLYLGVKSLQLKILYELESWDALDSLLESFRVYLQRRPNLGYVREHYQYLINYTRRLLQLPPGDQVAQTALAQEIQTTDALREKEWFLERLSAL